MQNTLQNLLKQCLIDSHHGKIGPDPLQYPSQILCLCDTINFTTKCEEAIKSATLPPLLAMYKVLLDLFIYIEILIFYYHLESTKELFIY